jgi:hypothetical protein
MTSSNKPHISDAVREALSKQIPEIRRGVLAVADAKGIRPPESGEQKPSNDRS